MDGHYNLYNSNNIFVFELVKNTFNLKYRYLTLINNTTSHVNIVMNLDLLKTHLNMLLMLEDNIHLVNIK